MVHPLANTAHMTDTAPLYNEEERANTRWQVYLQAQGTGYEGRSYVEVLLNVGRGYLTAIESSHPYLHSAIECLRTIESAMQLAPAPLHRPSAQRNATNTNNCKCVIYPSVLETIQELIGAFGAVESSQIFLEVLRQVSIDNEPITHDLVQRHLDYLLTLPGFCRVENEFGIHYGQDSDF